jgi:predicted metal-dependent peptidase
MPFDLNQHMYRLLQKEPFFAALSRRIDKYATTSIPTAGVRINPETYQFELHYNPEFFEKLGGDDPARGDVERLAVLKHEFYHLVYDHVTGRLPEEGLTKTWNIATDLAINSDIASELPDFACIPGKGIFKDYPSHKIAEWYYERVKKDIAKEKKKGKSGNTSKGAGQGQGESDSQQGEGQGESDSQQGEGSLSDYDSHDDHSGWEEVDEQTKTIARENIKDLIRKAAEEVANNGNNWGSCSSAVRQEIMKRLTSKLDWKSILRYFVRTSQKADRQSTMKKINRRYPYIHAGRKSKRQARIAISIDQSGSVSDSMLAAFFAELNKLAEIAEFVVIPFDSRVAEDKIFTWKKGSNRNWERVLSGGTDFNPPTKYVNDHDFDGHIIATDLCAPKPVRSHCQRMWITTEAYAARPYFMTNEKIIAIPESDFIS